MGIFCYDRPFKKVTPLEPQDVDKPKLVFVEQKLDRRVEI